MSDQVSVWIGTFPSEKALADYFEEQFDDQDKPLSPFAADQGQDYYDHDFIEFTFHKKAKGIADIVNVHSHAISYSAAVVAACKAKKITKANAIVLCFDGCIRKPKSVSKKGIELC